MLNENRDKICFWKVNYHCVYEKLSGNIMKCLLTDSTKSDSAKSDVDLALFIILPNQMFYVLTLPPRQILSFSSRYLVKAGDHNLKRRERSEQDIYPERFFVHEDYVDRKFINDIALIKLREEIKLSPFARTLCLPEKDEGDLAIPMKYGFVTGWGVTQALRHGEDPEPQNRYSTRLQYSAFTIQGGQLCANRSAIAFNSTVTFCAGDGKGGNDTCQGDSGGAFVREGKRGEDYRWVATGLVSWGLGCAQRNQYGYYTRVYPFTDWIKNTIKENTEAGD